MRNPVVIRERQPEFKAYVMLCTVCFAALLPIALLARLSGWSWRPWEAGPNGYESATRAAWSQAKTTAAITTSIYR